MPKGYRCAVLVALGWLILAASPLYKNRTNAHQPGAYANTQQSRRDITVALNKPDGIPDTDKGCEKGQENRNSDLCAQWKAADAAQASADWTGLMYPWVVVGTIIGGLTLFAAAAAAIYARDAAKAAGMSLDHERVRTIAELQPYVFPSTLKLEPASAIANEQVVVTFKNFGQTPARALIATVCTDVVPYPIQQPLLRIVDKRPFAGDIPPQGDVRIVRVLNKIHPFTRDKVGGAMAMVVYVELEYRSEFATGPISFHAHYICAGTDVSEGKFRRYNHYDDSPYKS